MLKYNGPKVKILKRLQVFYLRYFSTKKLKSNKYPGEHPISFSKRKLYASIFFNRFANARKLLKEYLLTSKSFKNILKHIQLGKRNKLVDLYNYLELRLDVILVNLGLAKTLYAARQLINHGKIYVNGKKIIFPGFICELNSQIVLPNDKIPSEIFYKKLKYFGLSTNTLLRKYKPEKGFVGTIRAKPSLNINRKKLVTIKKAIEFFIPTLSRKAL